MCCAVASFIIDCRHVVVLHAAKEHRGGKTHKDTQKQDFHLLEESLLHFKTKATCILGVVFLAHFFLFFEKNNKKSQNDV